MPLFHSTFLTFVPAYAKINLTLDVLGKRDDGYHRLASVMQTVALHDILSLRDHTPQASDGADAVLCDCDVAELQTPMNLAARAARLMLAAADNAAPGIALEVQKAIPSQAGLGGGSSDAASVLNALNLRWNLHLPPDRLEQLGATLGSDVPFFIRGGTALIEGRGENVTHLPDAEPLWLILAKPAIGLSTPVVFGSLTPDGYTTGEDTAAVVQAIRDGFPLPWERLTNALEPGVLRRFPAVVATRDALLAAGAPLVRMSGSGPTLYALFRSLHEAASVYRALRLPDAGRAWLTRTVSAAVTQRE